MAPKARINWQQVGVSDRAPTTMCGYVALTGQPSIRMRAFPQLRLNAVWRRMERIPRLWGNPQLKEEKAALYPSRSLLGSSPAMSGQLQFSALSAMCGDFRDFAWSERSTIEDFAQSASLKVL